MATSDIIDRLVARLTASYTDRELPSYLTRDIGGQFRNNQPYISGYFQLMFGVPERLFGAEASSSVTWLTSTCEGFNPHSVTVNTADVIGQGGIGSTFPVSKTITREFTTMHREYQNLPVINVIKLWSSMFDEFTGVSPLQGSEFIPSNYKGWAAVIQTKPTVSRVGQAISAADIEECYIYQGVFPKVVPIDTLSSDVTANDTAQLSVTWSFDGAPLTSAEDNVVSRVLEMFNTMKYLDTFDKYTSFVG